MGVFIFFSFAGAFIDDKSIAKGLGLPSANGQVIYIYIYISVPTLL